MLLPHGTVIALVDGQTLELYRNTGTEAEPALAALDSPKLDSRNHSGVSHHSSAGNHAGGLVNEDAHAAAAAEWLNDAVLAHRVEHIVLFAAPRTLGELRKHLRKTTEQAVLKQYDKDMVGKPAAAILSALQDVH
ncbi:host attachment protein [Novosphingobium aquiterrae]|uniref:Host attachment protein n=1 Tax=Novosphingobium aquiterrae TaxID=624388 RepID=A0ABV6PLX8_9SPHN